MASRKVVEVDEDQEQELGEKLLSLHKLNLILKPRAVSTVGQWSALVVTVQLSQPAS